MLSKRQEQFLSKLDGDVERVGFILKTGRVVEVENVCPEPTEGFDVSGEDIAAYAMKAKATWHTHPNASNNLSTNDFQTFLSWPELDHYIIGNDGIRRYYVAEGEVLIGS